MFCRFTSRHHLTRECDAHLFGTCTFTTRWELTVTGWWAFFPFSYSTYTHGPIQTSVWTAENSEWSGWESEPMQYWCLVERIFNFKQFDLVCLFLLPGVLREPYLRFGSYKKLDSANTLFKEYLFLMVERLQQVLCSWCDLQPNARGFTLHDSDIRFTRAICFSNTIRVCLVSFPYMIHVAVKLKKLCYIPTLYSTADVTGLPV